MAIIQKIHRITDLPELTNVNNAKVLVAYNGKNYVISSNLIKGKKISSITEKVSDKDSGLNVITIKFNDGTRSNIYVYNGSQGKQGQQGFEGEQGDTGSSGYITEAQLRAITRNPNATLESNVFKVVNDYIISNNHTAHDEYCSSGWSAYRGKSANENIIKLNETFVSDAEYDILWNNINYIIAEYTTDTENQETLIFSNDTNTHKLFKKFWTYEESDVATYFVAIYGYIITYDVEGNEISREYGKVRYDPVTVNLWTDIYMGEDHGYFEASRNQINDIQPLYVYDPNDSEHPYKEITIDTNPETITTVTNDDGETITKVEVNESYKDKDFNFWSDGLHEYLHAHYYNSINTWKYDLSIDDSLRYEKPLYIEDIDHGQTIETEDGPQTIYPLIPVTDRSKIDTAGFTKYYSSDNKDSEIENISDYLDVSNVRCFIKEEYDDNGTTKTRYKEVPFETKYKTKEERSEYLESLENSFKEYILITIDKVEQTYTFDYHYNVEYRRELLRKLTTEVYSKGNVTLYAYFDSREYYTSEMKEVIDEPATDDKPAVTHFETVYNRIIIPSWIYAEFTTNYEDEESIIINSIKELGEEDNTQIDITAEDYEEIDDTEIIPIEFIGYLGMNPIYEKNGYELYNTVDLDKIDISGSTIYYMIDGYYEEISGDKAIDIPNIEAIYIKLDETTYMINDGAILKDNTYYIWKETRTQITNIAEYISNQNITIFTGIPVQLPIRFFPLNATNKFATIQYDSDIVTMLEDGRICAIAESLDENNETHTTLTITPKEGNPLIFNITVLTPMSSIEMGLGEDKENELKINIGEETNVECILKPSTTSNKRIIFNYDSNVISITGRTENPGADNKTKANIKGLNKGTTQITAVALDGFGASNNCSIEVVKPVTSVSWNQDFVKEIKYTRNDINDWIAEWREAHPGEELPTDIPTTNTVKERRITILKDVDYELLPKIEPLDCSYPELEWESSNVNFVKVNVEEKIVIDEPQQSHIATQEDIDNDVKVNSNNVVDENGHLVEIGDLVITKEEINHTEKQYMLNGSHVTYTIDDLEGYDSDNPETAKRIYIKGQLKNIFGNKTDKYPIESYIIINQSVENVEVSPSTLSFNIGTTKKLTATLTPDNAVKTFEWVSSDTNIATVSTDGIVTAKTPGTTKIYANALDGSKKYGTCDITVTVPMNDINFKNTINGIIYVGIGKTETINASLVYDSYSTALDNVKLGVDWSSTDISKATVQDAGTNSTGDNCCNVTGVDLGSTTIIAKAKDNSGTIGAIQVMVIKQIENISFGEMNEITMDVNDSLSLLPIFDPVDSTNQVLTWTSSDTNIASVNSSGIVTALSSGEVVITATTTDGSNKTAECNVTII